jgi:beta-mannosidase
VTVALPGLLKSGATVTVQASVTEGYSNVSLVIPASATNGVQLWHPRGNGGQHRYNVTATFTPSSSSSASASVTKSNQEEQAHLSAGSAAGGGQQVVAPVALTWRLLGFRHVALVTINDTDTALAAAAKDQDGTDQFSMFFRVNGAAIYARGGNKIPMDLIDGRMSATAHRRLVQSAAEGNMNMLRVWGGGIWEPRAWFDACDEFGVMLYLDMQFTWGSVTVPGATSETVRKELVYQIERISHHASVVLLDGCNECGGAGLTTSFVMTTVAQTDPSRAVWPSCPASGWASGVDRLTARANGKIGRAHV